MDRSKCIFVTIDNDIQVVPVTCKGVSPNILLCRGGSSHLYHADKRDIERAKAIEGVQIYQLSELPKAYLAYLQDMILVHERTKGVYQPCNIYKYDDSTCFVGKHVAYFDDARGYICDGERAIYVVVEGNLALITCNYTGHCEIMNIKTGQYYHKCTECAYMALRLTKMNCTIVTTVCKQNAEILAHFIELLQNS